MRMEDPHHTTTPPSDVTHFNISHHQQQQVTSNSILTSNAALFHSSSSSFVNSTDLWNHISALQQSVECKICDSTFKSTASLPCGHLFCHQCLQNLSKRKCPVCYVDYTKRSVVEVPQVDATVHRVQALVGLVGDLMTPSRMTPRVVSSRGMHGNGTVGHALHLQTPLTLRRERSQKRAQNMDIDALRAEVQRVEDWIRIKMNEKQQVRQCIDVIRTQGLSALNEDKWPILSYLRSRHSSPSRALNFGSSSDTSVQHPVVEQQHQVSLNHSASREIEYCGMYSKYDDDDVVVITTGLDEGDRQIVEQVMQIIGGRFVNDFSSEVTHVVTSVSPTEGTAKRTVKYACGVLQGCWIVSMDWIVESLENKRWLNEKCFEVSGDTKDIGAPAKGRERRLAKRPPIFQGVKVLFCGDFSSPYPPRNDLELISETGGAQLIEDVASEYDRTKDSLLLIVGRMSASAREEIENNLGVRSIHYTW
eukprot:CAMPEP_0117452170 /NCGR_PEP_ID=MMETSP0759-20121206/9449_1 /TAXON_ID=63605 /ORGANISM="Percolomonas cosmopolitus, Strain WS" /LENGTH=476 /DNA_ID=CAMNT_0005244921 /DNA_START=200 /DNA_END=1627 /DNA_ORIENTATION=+